MFFPGFPNARSFDGFWHEMLHVPTILWGLIWAVAIHAVVRVWSRSHHPESQKITVAATFTDVYNIHGSIDWPKQVFTTNYDSVIDEALCKDHHE
jgi:hypothetical protein